MTVSSFSMFLSHHLSIYILMWFVSSLRVFYLTKFETRLASYFFPNVFFVSRLIWFGLSISIDTSISFDISCDCITSSLSSGLIGELKGDFFYISIYSEFLPGFTSYGVTALPPDFFACLFVISFSRSNLSKLLS